MWPTASCTNTSAAETEMLGVGEQCRRKEIGGNSSRILSVSVVIWAYVVLLALVVIADVSNVSMASGWRGVCMVVMRLIIPQKGSDNAVTSLRSVGMQACWHAWIDCVAALYQHRFRCSESPRNRAPQLQGLNRQQLACHAEVDSKHTTGSHLLHLVLGLTLLL